MHRTAALMMLASTAIAVQGCTARGGHLLHGYPAFADPVSVNVVVEIPAGSNDKWVVDNASGVLQWEQDNGRPRVVQYLPYPGNYGMIPRTRLPRSAGGDGDPLDVLLLGPAIERGRVVPARAIGVLRLSDGGERDDKILAVGLSGPLSDVTGLDALESKYPGAMTILETWFTHYKGPGHAVSGGFGDAGDALAIIREASRYFEAADGGP